MWRNGRVAKNSIVVKSDFPSAYYAGGNFSTQCTTLQDPSPDDALKYCEDGTFWDLLDNTGKLEERRLLISCDSGRKAWNTVMGPLRDPNPRGSLWVYAPKYKRETARLRGAPPPPPQRLALKDYPKGHDFHPLGLEIYPSHAGNASNLYVVNHARHATVIEHFVLSPSSPSIATYVRTISSPYFVSPNSIALTSPDSFYVTNDHLFTRRLPIVGHALPILESVLGLPLSFVSHITLFPASSSNPASSHISSHTFSTLFIPFSNGIALSHSGTQLALVSTSLNKILLYARDPAPHGNPVLTLTHTIPVPFSPDNIMYDDAGALIVAGHPHFPSLIAVAAGKPHAIAPSWVLSIAPRDLPSEGESAPPAAYDTAAPVSAGTKVPAARTHAVETLFQSDGTGFSTSATGLRDAVSGVLYVTGLYAEQGVLVCRPVFDDDSA